MHAATRTNQSESRMNHISYQLMLARHDELLREAASRRLAKQATQATEQATGRPAERKRASASARRHRVPLLVASSSHPAGAPDPIARRRPQPLSKLPSVLRRLIKVPSEPKHCQRRTGHSLTNRDQHVHSTNRST
jgi:hypothetical protein